MNHFEGFCDKRFEPVRKAFLYNFAELDELGAGVALYVEDELVANLWGGYKTTGKNEPWEEDTLVCVASVSKAFVATALLILVDEDRCSVNDHVSLYWPEFAKAGKDSITIEQVLTHQAGLPGITKPLPPTAYMDWEMMIQALEEQEPLWQQGTMHGYHPITFGFIIGEVVRRITGVSIGRFIADKICGPRDLDFYLGLDPGKDWNIADMQAIDFNGDHASPEFHRLKAQREKPDSYWAIATSNPKMPEGIANWPEYRHAEVPAGNGHATALGIAGLYNSLLGNSDVLRPATLAKATSEHVFGPDAVLGGVPSRFGLGFMLRQDYFPVGPSPAAYGHSGAGGNLGFADPDNRVAFGYVQNQGKPSMFGSSSAYTLVDAIYESLG